ncbi:MAG: pseudouridine synthase [Alphaproteobacteria bacterium]|nr:pseudouridine synthase [Alphaproteobacteria bacterium SS10]
MNSPTKKSEQQSSDAQTAKDADKGERIAKRMARAGLCSRREAEAWITAGRVKLNGKVLETPAVTVGPQDRVEVDGKPLPDAEPVRLWRYHKPAGLVTTNKDPEGRETIFDRLPRALPRVITVGRLDLNSEGLLLLTNDGETARRLELPTTGWLRKYRARVHGTVNPDVLKKLADGHEVSGIKYGPIDAALERQVGANAWVTVGLREGKNREVRKVLESIGLTVNRLIRISYGPFQLGNLGKGGVEELSAKVIAEQLGIGRAAGDAPKKEGRPTGHAKAKPKNRPPHKAKKAARKQLDDATDKPAQGKGHQGKKHQGKPGPAKSAPGKSVPGKSVPGKSVPGKPAGGKPSSGRSNGKPHNQRQAPNNKGNKGPRRGPNQGAGPKGKNRA